MKSGRDLSKGSVWGGAIVAWVLCLVLAGGPPQALGVERLILKYEGGIGGLNFGLYGMASVAVKVKGEAWLLAESGGQWKGIGRMTARTDVQAAPSRGVTISPATAPEANFNVTAKVKGGKLEFWFQSKPIELKGVISAQAPAPVGVVTQPYSLKFDPATVAPGPPAALDIEMRDGAIKTVDYNQIPSIHPVISGVMVFSLNNVEEWRVQVTGLEKDILQPPITNSALKPPNTELPLMTSFAWNLTGMFYIAGGKTSPAYYEGIVFSANYTASIYFDFQDLYKCFFIPCGSQAEPMSAIGQRFLPELSGKPIAGKVSAGSVRLTWPEYFPKECVRCKPIKTYLGQAFVTRTFGTKEFLFNVSGETLPLKDGATVKGSVKDWLSYTILLRKAK